MTERFESRNGSFVARFLAYGRSILHEIFEIVGYHLVPHYLEITRDKMEPEASGDDIYEALNLSGRYDGVIKPGDKTERFAFSASLFKYDEKSYEALKKLISEDGGVIKPVLTVKDKRKTVIIDGWHRILVAKELDIPCPAVFCEGLTESQIENAALSLNLSGRRMRLKERRGIAIALYEQRVWGYGRISKTIGDNNKSNVQRWVTKHKMMQGEGAMSGGDGETEFDMICGILGRGFKKC
jgi:hypothetical protein